MRAIAPYAACALTTAAVTLLALPLHGVLEPANIVMLYLLATVGVALLWGRGPAAMAAFLNVAIFDFVFVPPSFSFRVSDLQYVVTFAVMLGVGLAFGQLIAMLRREARTAALRESRATSLFELTRDLSAALHAPQVAQIGAAATRGYFGGEAVVMYTGLANEPVAPEAEPAGFEFDAALESLHVLQVPQVLLARESGWHYLPLQAPMRVRGVLAMRPSQAHALLVPEQRQHLETLARQIAIALERVHYVEVAQNALVEMESERLRNTMLAAISHDVRTPLTALIGLAESLATSQPELAPAQAETAHALAQQARELAALVNNLLEMARLQSGKVKLRVEWQSAEEAVGCALRAARASLTGKAVNVHVPSDLPLVEFDATLMERVLVNLLENAARYGAAPIEVDAQVTPHELVMTVRDHGPGLPAALRGKENTLFEKFTRGEAESHTPGVGLGLAICKAIVDAHKGRIEVRNAEGGGAEFSVRLPRRTPPALPNAFADALANASSSARTTA